MDNLSPYARTAVNRSGYLDILSPRPVPVNKEDIVFAQRNMDILKDPVFDFVAGTKIFLPDPSALKNTLGF